MHRLLDLDDPPTALFANSDLLAASQLQTLYGRACRVPDDISDVGFDDIYAAYLAPALTTVGQPMVEMGRAAANRVFARLAQPDAAERLRSVPTRLIIRASTGPAGGKGGLTTNREERR